MRYLRYAVFVVSYVTATAAPVVIHPAVAQPTQPTPELMPEDATQAAPDWLVWRAYHDSLAFYGQRSPAGVDELLVQDLRLTTDEAIVVQAAGGNYLQQLAQIDDSARAEIRARFQVGNGPRSPATRFQRKAPAPPVDLIGSRAPEDKGLREALVADGFIARIEQRRVAAFIAHRAELASKLGPTKLAALDEFIRAEVAPNVRIVPHLPPAPSGPRSGLTINELRSE